MTFRGKHSKHHHDVRVAQPQQMRQVFRKGNNTRRLAICALVKEPGYERGDTRDTTRVLRETRDVGVALVDAFEVVLWRVQEVNKMTSVGAGSQS